MREIRILDAINYTPDFAGYKKVGLTPVRITYTPLALVPAEGKWKVARRILKIWVEETYLAGSLNGADFGNPSSAFKSNGEWKTRWGAIIDLTPLLSLRR